MTTVPAVSEHLDPAWTKRAHYTHDKKNMFYLEKNELLL